MRKLSFILLFILFFSCNWNSKKVIQIKFQNSVNNEINDSIKADFLKGKIDEKPIIYINGEKFIYNEKSDTIVLPFNMNDMTNFLILREEVSVKVYGEEGKSGAIVLTKVNEE